MNTHTDIYVQLQLHISILLVEALQTDVICYVTRMAEFRIKPWHFSRYFPVMSQHLEV
jgi:hypothetical protein